MLWLARGRVAVVGHRGGRDGPGGPGDAWPVENTLAAFARAHAEGADAVELDVRTCLGGEIVVCHDADLSRVSGGNDTREVAAMTPGEVARVRLSGEPIPTLDDVLAWARTRVAVNVEMKRDVPDRVALVRGVARCLRAHAAEVVVSSFDPALLAALAILAPRVRRALLTHAGQHASAFAWKRVAARAPVHALHLEDAQATPSMIAYLRRHRRDVGVWTVNDPARAVDLAARGVYAIITDAPGRIRAALVTRT